MYPSLKIQKNKFRDNLSFIIKDTCVQAHIPPDIPHCHWANKISNFFRTIVRTLNKDIYSSAVNFINSITFYNRDRVTSSMIKLTHKGNV